MLPSVLIVDDEKHTRDGLRQALEDDYDVSLAANADEAFNLLDAQPFDAVLTDLRMPGKSGLKVIDKALAMPQRPAVIMMTAYGNVDTAVEAMKRGAVDFLTKPVAGDELVDAVRRALAADAAGREDRRVLRELRARYMRLTPREREVFALVAGGLLNKQIAGELGTSERTVKAHRAHVMRKLDVASVADLARAAERLGMTLRQRSPQPGS